MGSTGWGGKDQAGVEKGITTTTWVVTELKWFKDLEVQHRRRMTSLRKSDNRGCA